MYLISQSILKQYGVLDIRFRKITMKHKKLDIWLYIVFAIYCAFLVWVILFKLQFSLKEIEQTRSINFIPFYNDGKGTVEFHISEAIDNFLIFAPFGLLLAMMRRPKSLQTKFWLIPFVSLFFETMQYILSVGRSDITDIITNTAGGVLGIVVFFVLARLVKNREKLRLILTIISSTVIFLIIGALLFIIGMN